MTDRRRSLGKKDLDTAMRKRWAAAAGPRIGALALMGLVGGCAASVPTLESTTDRLAAGWQTDAELTPDGKAATLARATAENPKDLGLALDYAQRLKSQGKTREAVAVLDKAAEGAAPGADFHGAHGLMALDAGELRKAQRLLSLTAPATQDWRIISGLGVALASQGKQAEAQRQFRRALELSPNNPAVLNNLAMSHILDRKVEEAEVLLRRAASAGMPRPQVSQNLALAAALKSEGAGSGIIDMTAPEAGPAAQPALSEPVAREPLPPPAAKSR